MLGDPDLSMVSPSLLSTRLRINKIPQPPLPSITKLREEV